MVKRMITEINFTRISNTSGGGVGVCGNYTSGGGGWVAAKTAEESALRTPCPLARSGLGYTFKGQPLRAGLLAGLSMRDCAKTS